LAFLKAIGGFLNRLLSQRESQSGPEAADQGSAPQPERPGITILG
jgi:hypothetical protein